MKPTINMLNELRINSYKDVKCNDLIKDYKITKNPSIFAELFHRCIGNVLGLEKKYYSIDGSEIVSQSLIVLDKSMLNFDIEGNTKIQTYFSYNLENALKVELNKSRQKKRAFKTVPLSDTLGYTYEDRISIADLKIQNPLQKQYLLGIRAGYKIVEIAKMLNISRNIIYDARTSLIKNNKI